jgi:hypothetical protein
VRYLDLSMAGRLFVIGHHRRAPPPDGCAHWARPRPPRSAPTRPGAGRHSRYKRDGQHVNRGGETANLMAPAGVRDLRAMIRLS